LSSIAKWKTGLLQYREFLYEYIETKIVGTIPRINDMEEDLTVYPSEMSDFDFKNLHDDDSDTMLTISLDGPEINGSAKKWIYKKEDLYKIFRFRLITQDRYYNEIF